MWWKNRITSITCQFEVLHRKILTKFSKFQHFDFHGLLCSFPFLSNFNCDFSCIYFGGFTGSLGFYLAMSLATKFVMKMLPQYFGIFSDLLTNNAPHLSRTTISIIRSFSSTLHDVSYAMSKILVSHLVGFMLLW